MSLIINFKEGKKMSYKLESNSSFEKSKTGEITETEVEEPIGASYEKENKSSENVKQFEKAWMQIGENAYQAAYRSIKKLDSAFYKVAYSNARHDFIYTKFNITTDRIIDFQQSFIKKIEEFFTKFWSKKDIYKEKGLVHKAGLLFYGDPGNGKTTICLNSIKYLLSNYKGIAIQTDSLNDLASILAQIREIEPDTYIIVLLEELDRLIYNSSDRYLLQLLDGADNINHVLYLGTTNYIEKIEDNLKNRPSRFNRVWEITSPDENSRRSFITNKLNSEELASIDLEQWIKDTNRFSLDHLKELINAVFIFGDDYTDTVKTISGMCKIKNTQKEKTIKLI